MFYGVVLRTGAHRISRLVYFRTLGELQFGYAMNNPVAPEVQEVLDRLIELGRKHGIPTPANEILYLTITARQKLSELRKS